MIKKFRCVEKKLNGTTQALLFSITPNSLKNIENSKKISEKTNLFPDKITCFRLQTNPFIESIMFVCFFALQKKKQFISLV